MAAQRAESGHVSWPSEKRLSVGLPQNPAPSKRRDTTSYHWAAASAQTFRPSLNTAGLVKKFSRSNTKLHIDMIPGNITKPRHLAQRDWGVQGGRVLRRGRGGAYYTLRKLRCLDRCAPLEHISCQRVGKRSDASCNSQGASESFRHRVQMLARKLTT